MAAVGQGNFRALELRAGFVPSLKQSHSRECQAKSQTRPHHQETEIGLHDDCVELISASHRDRSFDKGLVIGSDGYRMMPVLI